MSLLRYHAEVGTFEGINELANRAVEFSIREEWAKTKLWAAGPDSA